MPGRVRRHPLALCGVLAPAVFFGASAVAATAQPGYSSRREDLSALAALDAREAWIMVGGMVALGALVLVFALGLLVQGDRLLRPAALPLLVAGPATIAAGLLRIDCSERVDAACAARSGAGLLSWHDEAHNLMAALLVVTFALAPLVAAVGLRGVRDARRLAWGSGATAAAIAVLAAVYFSELAGSWSGLVQRALAAVALAWVAVAALRLLRSPADRRSGASAWRPGPSPPRRCARRRWP
jgi:hypothetical protein